jgi:hypothetical protein
VLSATVTDRKKVAVTYQPSRAGRWEVHVAVLGFGVSTNVKAGETAGESYFTTSSPRRTETKADDSGRCVRSGGSHAANERHGRRHRRGGVGH